MWRKILCLLLILLQISRLPAEEKDVSPELKAFMLYGRREAAPFQKIPWAEDNSLDKQYGKKSQQAYQINFFTPQVRIGAWQFLNMPDLWDENNQPDFAAYQLGIWSSLEPHPDDFQKMREYVVKIEEPTSLHPALQLSRLSQGYLAMGRINTSSSQAFLKERMRAKFWGDRLIRWNVYSNSVPTKPEELDLRGVDCQQKQAIVAYNALGESTETAFVKSLLEDIEISNKPNLVGAIEAALLFAEGNRKDYLENLDYYHWIKYEKPKLLGNAGAAQNTNLSSGKPQSIRPTAKFGNLPEFGLLNKINTRINPNQIIGILFLFILILVGAYIFWRRKK